MLTKAKNWVVGFYRRQPIGAAFMGFVIACIIIGLTTDLLTWVYTAIFGG